jgi:hypothetical protein
MVPASTAQNPNQGAPGGPQPLPPNSRSRPLQQALLSPSQLHIDHGHVDAATKALLEAVDVGQGSGDAQAMVMCLMQLCVSMHATTPDCTGGAKSPASLVQVLHHRVDCPVHALNLYQHEERPTVHCFCCDKLCQVTSRNVTRHV